MRMKISLHRIQSWIGFMASGLAAASIFLLAGCGGKAEEEDGLFKITLQTDWYAQPEHGGFYHALVMGYYEEEGLEVDIIPGGPNSLTMQKIAQGDAQFAIGRSDDVIITSGRGIPVTIIGALMQKDPQAIMFHKESGITGPKDLDGRAIMAGPGSAFLEIMKLQYGIDFAVIPMDYGMNRFLADKQFVQQCFITNEPFYVAREGADVGTFLLSESGFNPYRVWFTSRSFLRRHPDKVAAFHRASIRGWREYLFGDDRAATNAMIASRNPKMDEAFMAFSLQTMIAENLVTGDSGDPADIGKVTPERIQEQIDQLIQIKMIEGPASATDILPSAEFWNLVEGKQAPAAPPSAAVVPASKGHALPITNFAGKPLLTVDADDFQALPWLTREIELETAGELTTVRGVPLLELLAHLDLQGNWDLVLADCTDGYQSNYTRDVLRNNFPFLILEIEGKSTAEWTRAAGNPQWGPYMIQVLNPEGLLDPVNKNPWGVVGLQVGRFADLWPKISQPMAQADPNHVGFQVFKANCLSCHRYSDTQFGGVASTRNVSMLGMLARYSEHYFRALLKDPAGTNILAQKMPAATHYDEAQISALIAYLAYYAP